MSFITYKGIFKTWTSIIQFVAMIILIIVCILSGFSCLNAANTALVLVGIGLILLAILFVFVLLKWFADKSEKAYHDIDDMMNRPSDKEINIKYINEK